MDSRNKTPAAGDSRTSKAMLPMAFFVPLIIATAYLNMGPTCCGTCPPGPVIYPNHISVDFPYMEIVGTASNESREEPYFISFSWEATSATASVDGYALHNFKGSGKTPTEVFVHARKDEKILLGEDISNAVFDFPDVGFSEQDATSKHIKIAGLTMCAFEQDDGNRKNDIKTEIERGFAGPLRDALANTYSKEPFTKDSTAEAFINAYGRFKDQARDSFNALTDPQKEQARPLYDTINQQIDDAIDIANQAISQKAIGASAIVGIIGSGVKLITNLVSLFRKKHVPDNDDFAGCASVVFVGLPFAVLNQSSSVPTCSAGGGGGLDLAVCAIDADATSTVLRFAPPWDITTGERDRRWIVQLDARAGQYRTSSGTKQPNNMGQRRGTAHEYKVMPSGSSGVFPMPRTEGPSTWQRYPDCSTVSSQSTTCEMYFAHVVNYQTLGADALGWEINTRPGRTYEVSASGNGTPRANVGVRLSTVTIPSHIKWKRQVVELEGRLESVDTKYSQYPFGWVKSPNVIVIPEILTLQENGSRGSTEVTVRTISDIYGRRNTQLRVAGPGNVWQCGGPYGPGPCTNTAKVRVTYLYWDTGVVDVSEAVVRSTDDERTPPSVPAYNILDWDAPYTDSHIGANLYFPMEFAQKGDHNAGFAIRATGTEVTDDVLVTGEARLYAQDFYYTNAAYVEAKIVNFRFR